MDRIRHTSEGLVPTVTILSVLAAVGIGVGVDFTNGSSEPTPVTTTDEDLSHGRFNPNQAGLKQWGSIDCDSPNPDYRQREVSVTPRSSSMSGVLRVMNGRTTVEAVKVSIDGDGSKIDIASWRPIPGLVADLNEGYRRMADGANYQLGGDSSLTISGDTTQTTLRITCDLPEPKTQPDS